MKKKKMNATGKGNWKYYFLNAYGRWMEVDNDDGGLMHNILFFCSKVKRRM
jgi:hypothetical protein